MTVIESPDGIVVVDAGIAFPRDEMLGVDLVLPDLAYLRDQAAPHARRRSSPTATRTTSAACRTCCARSAAREVWGTRLTLGLVKSKLDEHGLIRASELREIEPERGDPVPIGPFERRVRARHALHPGRRRGRAAHVRGHASCTPATSSSTTRRSTACAPTSRASRGPRRARASALMLGDSTNAENPGTTASEAIVAEALRRIMREAPGRVIVTSFASHIHRLQEVIDAAEAAAGARLRGRALDGQEPQHRAQPGLRRRGRRHC